MLSDYGFIDWESVEYCQNQAMQWEITDDLLDTLTVKEKKSISIEEATPSLPPITNGKRPINCWYNSYPTKNLWEMEKEVSKFFDNVV